MGDLEKKGEALKRRKREDIDNYIGYFTLISIGNHVPF